MFGFDVLELTNGTTTVDLLLSPYALVYENMPDLGIATLRPGTLGGNGLYTEVDCTIPIIVTGTCPANVYTALQSVWALLDQAQRFWKGEPGVTAVRLVAQATGSTVAAVEAMVLRRADADAPLVLPPVYEVTKSNYTMQGISLRFTRRGQWLGATDTATGTAQPSGTVFSVTVADHDTISPVIVNLSLPTSIAGSISLSPSTLILTDSTSNIEVTEAESFGASTQYTVVTPAAAEVARGTQVLRYTATPTAELQSASMATPTLLQSSQPVSIFALIRSTLTTFSISMRFFDALSTSIVAFETTPVLVDPLNQARPLPIFLGTVVPPPDTGYARMRIVCSNPTVSASTMDIDYLVFVKETDALTVITFPSLFAVVDPPYTVGTVMRLRSDHQTNSALAPFAGICTSANAQRTSISHNGPSLPVMRDTTLAGIWLSTGSATGSSSRWRFTNVADSLYSNTPSAERRRAYLTLP